MNSSLNNFYKVRVSKFNRFPIMCSSCTLRMNVTLTYDKENNCYNPKIIACKICAKPIEINIFPAVAKK